MFRKQILATCLLSLTLDLICATKVSTISNEYLPPQLEPTTALRDEESSGVEKDSVSSSGLQLPSGYSIPIAAYQQTKNFGGNPLPFPPFPGFGQLPEHNFGGISGAPVFSSLGFPNVYPGIGQEFPSPNQASGGGYLTNTIEGQGLPMPQGLPGQGPPSAQGFPQASGFPQGPAFSQGLLQGPNFQQNQGFPQGLGFPHGQGFQQGQGFPHGHGFQQGQSFPQGQAFPQPPPFLPGQGFPNPAEFTGQNLGVPSQGYFPGQFDISENVNTHKSPRVAADTTYGSNGGYVYEKP